MNGWNKQNKFHKMKTEKYKDKSGMIFWYVVNTPFFIWYGGKEVQGQLKWVIGSDSEKMFEQLEEFSETLWYTKAEAVDTIWRFYNERKK